MSQSDIASWTFVGVFLFILLWYVAARIPYGWRYLRRKNWPSANAVIQNFTSGAINRGRNCIVPACFVGYAFEVQEKRFGGYFVLIGKESTLQESRKNLKGSSVQIRYEPSDPDISLLVDYKDSRFEGLMASQDPDWLNQAPAFDLQDALRG
jgi:hypothetical protein